MRTIDEIVELYSEERDEDYLGFTGEVLLPYLPADKLKEFCKPDADLSNWEPLPLSKEKVINQMQEYMEFAWGKVEDHRGISAGRSVEKMAAWLWLLGDDELAIFAKDNDNYENYGAPILKRICEEYNFPIPESEAIQNMAEGKPCLPSCDMGCGSEWT